MNVDRERADADRFLRDVPAEFQIVYDPAGALAAHYDVPGMPVSYVIGPKGDIVGRHIGFRNALRAEREAELQKLLETTPMKKIPLCLVLLALAGCAGVQPWERDVLARPEMSLDNAPLDAAIDDHIYFSKEASSGGRGFGGGGCGCN